MPRPARITPQLAARIEEFRRQGLNRPAQLLRALESIGEPVGFRTLAAYLNGARVPAAAVIVPTAPMPAVVEYTRSTTDRATASPEPATVDRSAAIPVDPNTMVADAASALESDDLGRLRIIRDRIQRALDAWSVGDPPRIHFEPSAVRVFTALTKSLGELTARIVELTPRPDALAQQLAVIGAAKRKELLERARAAARKDEDLRGKNARLQQVLNDMVEAQHGGA